MVSKLSGGFKVCVKIEEIWPAREVIQELSGVLLFCCDDVILWVKMMWCYNIEKQETKDFEGN